MQYFVPPILTVGLHIGPKYCIKVLLLTLCWPPNTAAEVPELTSAFQTHPFSPVLVSEKRWSRRLEGALYKFSQSITEIVIVVSSSTMC